ncbi:MAG: phage virion morphogenesis protein [Gammaproteobacteria bacterium]
MPVGDIRIDDRQVMAALRRLQRRGADMTPAFNSVGRVLKSRIQLGYRTQTDPYGRAWEPLKTRRGKALRDRGNLRDAWDYRASGDQVEIMNNRTVSSAGGRFSLAAIHHFGATIKPRNPDGVLLFPVGGEIRAAKQVTIPARKQIPDAGLPDDWRGDVFRVIERHFARG